MTWFLSVGCGVVLLAGAAGACTPTTGAKSRAMTPAREGVLFSGHGIEIVATSDGHGERRPALFASTDSTHWRAITPPVAPASEPAGAATRFYPVFTSASFVTDRIGWVVACDDSDYRDAIFETTDGGRSWRPVAALGTDHCLVAVQLLSPGVAVLVVPTEGYVVGVRGIVYLTRDDGKTWQSLYPVNEPIAVPEVTRVVFAGVGEGFSAAGFVPFSNIGVAPPGYFQVSRDGGRTWMAATPPSPGGQVVYDVPVFLSPDDGVLPALGDGWHRVALAFDTTGDGGRSWQARAALPVDTVRSTYPGVPYEPYPAVSVASMSTWWVVQPARPVATSVTVDAGRHWTTVASRGLPTTPSQLAADDGTHALANVELPSSDQGSGAALVYRTDDGGRSWRPIDLAGG